MSLNSRLLDWSYKFACDLDGVDFLDMTNCINNISRKKNMTFRRAKKLVEEAYFDITESAFKRHAVTQDRDMFTVTPEDYDLDEDSLETC